MAFRPACCLAGVAMGAAGILLAGCGDDTVSALPDGGTDGSVSFDAPPYETGNGSDGEEIEASTDAGDGGEAQAPTAARLLVSYNGSSGSQLVAFDLQSLAVDGILTYPGALGTTFVTPTIPWLLERSNDVVARLDALQPWMVQSSWNVALNDRTDAGYAQSSANPTWVVAAGTKDYVLRYDRNLVAVLDSTVIADGGSPIGTVDLSGQVQAGGDGYVEMVGGYYDGNRLAYVLLGNINRFEVVPVGGIDTQRCTATSPTIVAIDTTSDSLVNLNADAGETSSMGWTLQGYDPPLGASPMVFDGANNRLLVLESGCTTQAADGGAGPVVRSGVEAVSLADGSTQMLLDLSSTPGVAAALFYFDAHHAVIQFQPPAAYAWDPTTSALGAQIPAAPDVFVLDGRGNLIGVSQPVAPDGGLGDFAVTSVNPWDGGATSLGQIPGSVAHGSLAGAQLWPAP